MSENSQPPTRQRRTKAEVAADAMMALTIPQIRECVALVEAAEDGRDALGVFEDRINKYTGRRYGRLAGELE